MAKPLKVLLIEDSEAGALEIVEGLQRDDLRFVWERVQTAIAFRERVGVGAWDVVVAADTVADLAVGEVLDYLRGQDLDLPVVVVAAIAGEELAVKTLKAGAADYVLRRNLTGLSGAIQGAVQAAQHRQRQRQEHQRLVEKESQFHGIFATMFQFVGLLDLDGTLLEANDNALVVAGLEPEDVIGRPFWDCYWWRISPETQAQLRQAIADARTGKFVRYEVEVWGLNQTVLPIDFSLRPLVDRHTGTVKQLVAEGREIRKIRQAQQVILRQRDASNLMIEITNRFVAIRAEDLEQEIRRSLEQISLFMGVDSYHICSFRRSQPSGTLEPFCDVVYVWYPDHIEMSSPPPQLPIAAFPWAIGEQLLQGNVVNVGDVEGLPDRYGVDREHWLQLRLKSVLSIPLVEGGTVVGFIGFSRVTTAAPWDELMVQLLKMLAQTIANARQRLQIEANLAASEAKSRVLLSMMPDLILRVGTDGRYREVISENVDLDIVGSPEGRLGRHIRDILPADLVEMTLQKIQETMISQDVQTFEQELVLGDRRQYEEVRIVRSGEDEVIFLIRDVGDRRRAELQLQELNQSLERKVRERTAELKEREVRYRGLLEGAGDAIIVWDLAGHILEVNQQAVELWGYPREELVQLPLSALYPPEAIARVSQSFQEVIDQGQTQLLSVHLQAADGSQIPVDITRSFIDLGTTQVVQGIIRDIRDRQQIEAENRQLRDRLEFLLSFSRAVIYSCRPGGDYGATFMGKSVKEILGYSAEAFTTTSDFWVSRIHPDDQERIFAELPHIFDKEFHYYEYRFLHQDGHYIWVGDEMCLVRDQQGNPLEIIGYFTDITKRKEAEQSLQESRSFIETVLNTVPLPTFWKNRHSEFLGCNQLLAEVLGLSAPEDIVGKTDFDFSIKAEAIAYRRDDEEVMTTGESKLGIEETLTLPNGEQIWLLTYKAPLRGWQDEVIGVVGMFQNITDRKRAELKLRDANSELQQATRLKDEFLANMSHELRTPLNAILGMSETLQDEVFGSLNTNQRRSVEILERSANHLLALINDVLDVSKIAAGQVTLERAPTAIAKLCKVSLDLIKKQAQQKHIQLQLAITPDLPPPLLDERRIQQVLLNLLSNAVKFTPEEGKVKLSVSREIAPADQLCEYLLRFTVEDNGIGIAADQIKNLFQPFIQIDSALNRQYQGTGLGLALVKQIAELHGGSASLCSELGVGSRFWVDIPYEIEADGQQPRWLRPSDAIPRQWISPRNQGTDDTPPATPLILVVEDQSIETLQDYLQAKGFSLRFAENGREAIAMVQEQIPDLILMDIQMPEMDGLAAIQHIRQDLNLKDLPIIAMTAFAMEGDRERCLAQGANDYISKPVRLKHLVLKIQDLLGAPTNP